jgi:type IV pilus assembly protein PilN
VQVTSIEPQISADGNVIIHLRVSGERDRAVQLVRNLERSKRFLSPRLTGEAAQAKEAGTQGNNPAFNNSNNLNNGNSLAPPGVEFEILADYNPLPEGETYATAKSEKATDSDKPRSSKSAGKNPAGKGDGVVLKPYSATQPKPPNGGAR